MLDFLQYLKYLATAITVGYGIYAITHDFHITKNGRRILTQAGIRGRWVLIVSGLVAVGTDWYKDYNETRANEVREKRDSSDLALKARLTAQMDTAVTTLNQELETSRSISSALGRTAVVVDSTNRHTGQLAVTLRNAVARIDSASHKTQRVLDELAALPPQIERATSRLSDMTTGFVIKLPIQAAEYVSYRRSFLDAVQRYTRQHRIPADAYVNASADSLLTPRALLAGFRDEFLNRLGVQVMLGVYPQESLECGIITGAEEEDTLLIDVQSELEWFAFPLRGEWTRLQLESPASEETRLTTSGVTPVYRVNSGKLIGLPDLVGTVMSLNLYLSPGLADFGSGRAEFVRRERAMNDSTDLEYFEMAFPDGRRIRFRDLLECSTSSGYRYWLFAFPRSLDSLKAIMANEF